MSQCGYKKLSQINCKGEVHMWSRRMRERLLPQKHFETAYEECSREGRCQAGTIYLLSMWQVILSRYEAHCTLSRRSSLKDLYGTNIIVLGIVLACAISYSNKDIELIDNFIITENMLIKTWRHFRSTLLSGFGVLRHCGLRLLQEKRVVNCMRLFYVKYERLKQ